jgi:hypothetical protein
MLVSAFEGASGALNSTPRDLSTASVSEGILSAFGARPSGTAGRFFALAGRRWACRQRRAWRQPGHQGHARRRRHPMDDRRQRHHSSGDARRKRRGEVGLSMSTTAPDGSPWKDSSLTARNADVSRATFDLEGKYELILTLAEGSLRATWRPVRFRFPGPFDEVRWRNTLAQMHVLAEWLERRGT